MSNIFFPVPLHVKYSTYQGKIEVPRDVRNSKGPYTGQVQESMVSTLEQMQNSNWLNVRNDWVKYHTLKFVCLFVCGLTSHSAIVQLYSDGTDVQFPNFDLLPGTNAMGS